MAPKKIMNFMNQVLHDRLKCQLCENRLSVGKYHWYKCLIDLNHEICQDCKDKICCGKEISNKFCKLTEELLQAKSMLFKCINESRGCQEIFGKEAMISHESCCIYRLVKCPSWNCELKLQFHELLQHMNETEQIVRDPDMKLKQILNGLLGLDIFALLGGK